MEEQKTQEELRKEILDILSYCINCRFCLPSCPRFEITSGDISQGASGMTRALYYAIKWSVDQRETLGELRDIIYSCTTCKNCELACKKLSTGTKLVEAIEKGRQFLIQEIGPLPKHKRTLESLLGYRNPYKMPPAERTNWAQGLDIPIFSKETNPDVLFYVGCTASYDVRVQNVARAIAQLLKKTQVRFGILNDEECCGEPALRLGESMLFEVLSNENLKQFELLGVKEIVTTSPHCFDTFANKYPEGTWTRKIRIRHYTQLFWELIEQGRLCAKKIVKRKIVYQDPCYLGRHNGVYDEPRKILRSIPGIELIELSRNRENSLCCGGGGGRMWTDFRSEKDRLGNIRVREAHDAGAEIIVIACPYCLVNLEDAAKTVGFEDSMVVKDVAELLLESVGL